MAQLENIEAIEKRVHYFYKQAHWLLSRFPDGELCDVEGLVGLNDEAVNLTVQVSRNFEELGI